MTRVGCGAPSIRSSCNPESGVVTPGPTVVESDGDRDAEALTDGDSRSTSRFGRWSLRPQQMNASCGLREFGQSAQSARRCAGQRCVEHGGELLSLHGRSGQEGSRTLETGAGVSTRCLRLGDASTSPSSLRATKRKRLEQYLDEQGIIRASLTFDLRPSEVALPKLAGGSPFDLVFVDGCHGFPSPIIDWFYGAGLRCERGGSSCFDDVQLPQVESLLTTFIELDDAVGDGGGHDGSGGRSVVLSEGSLGEDWFAQPFFSDALAAAWADAPHQGSCSAAHQTMGASIALVSEPEAAGSGGRIRRGRSLPGRLRRSGVRVWPSSRQRAVQPVGTTVTVMRRPHVGAKARGIQRPPTAGALGWMACRSRCSAWSRRGPLAEADGRMVTGGW